MQWTVNILFLSFPQSIIIWICFQIRKMIDQFVNLIKLARKKKEKYFMYFLGVWQSLNCFFFSMWILLPFGISFVPVLLIINRLVNSSPCHYRYLIDTIDTLKTAYIFFIDLSFEYLLGNFFFLTWKILNLKTCKNNTINTHIPPFI